MDNLYYGRIVNGKFVIDRKDEFQALRESLEGEEIALKLTKRQKDRSALQNRYYHGVVVKMLAEYTGHSCEDVHEGLKHRFLMERGDDSPLPRVRSTSSLTTAEFAQYVDHCVQLAAEFGVVIPDPQ